MSVLLVGAGGDVGKAVVARLVEQGDEVRVIEPDPKAADGWRALGAHVALGDPVDADLVERAAQNVRTVVVLSELEAEPVLRGALAAGVGRFVLCAGDFDLQGVENEDVDWIALVVPRTRFKRRAAIAPEALAEAVDAADDLAGHPRMSVDLGDAAGWGQLGLTGPSS